MAPVSHNSLKKKLCNGPFIWSKLPTDIKKIIFINNLFMFKKNVEIHLRTLQNE